MLGRLSRGIGHSGGRKGIKFRFDVTIDKLDNLPAPVKKCRVTWSRGAKLQATDVKDVNKGRWRTGQGGVCAHTLPAHMRLAQHLLPPCALACILPAQVLSCSGRS